ncbi:YdeI/OmpD-associated family protein [Candidatus Saccharibacteria bacterium]|nr:MAG: YdeI/OmpD-associated family protein [Candidatus Saccharibacteria bacterium]
MKKQTLASGTVHIMPSDLRTMLEADSGLVAAWQSITPLARNEFICWIVEAKKPETRARRILVAKDKLSRGERRPCCWIGCIHRTDKPLSPSVKGIMEKRSHSRG